MHKVIPFNRPAITGNEILFIQQVLDSGQLSGNGRFTKHCQSWLEKNIYCNKAFLTTSCTAALEMSGILMDLQPGDEVIMPSYTFVSTANAFVLRGAIPVFVDIRPDTLNLDESKIEAAITANTKAIAPVHYAGVGCEMDAILEIAQQHQLWVVEDAAQAISSTYKGKPLGSFGQLATLSFHETKNLTSGEGGALLVNYPGWAERAEILWEKGTNRSQFIRGQVDKYTWVDVGSSYLLSDINAAVLWAQLEVCDRITQRRLEIWHQYHQAFIDLEAQNKLRRPIVPQHCQHNAHMYYLLLPSLATRTAFIDALKQQGIQTVFHYIPLHSSPAGKKYGRSTADLVHTEALSERLVRLPLWFGMTDNDVNQVIQAAINYLAA
ncbi:dTDP-4-amino-4,6-dideoxygalactose transaminase [Phormidium sp. CLA17]|uniref:dTDP-4-amino-4,6-dideoxygalactose transaminase n=1 Tax=Leptolyngbya sp. Cla-17 TaxID=2803751 RepID=UPI00149150BA|nr:dTDP-4-amino-4,6-dideoxygalactose transaminase [Leptolyngbya sp. Cla-17]MBM0740836.1 dTDP-4-amino-4,6-dideoxygalactose transaminase [Leptolyngbya sp. Cla-17]